MAKGIMIVDEYLNQDAMTTRQAHKEKVAVNKARQADERVKWEKINRARCEKNKLGKLIK